MVRKKAWRTRKWAWRYKKRTWRSAILKGPRGNTNNGQSDTQEGSVVQYEYVHTHITLFPPAQVLCHIPCSGKRTWYGTVELQWLEL